MRSLWFTVSLIVLLGCGARNSDRGSNPALSPGQKTAPASRQQHDRGDQHVQSPQADSLITKQQTDTPIEVHKHGAPDQSYIDSVKAAKTKGKK